MEASQRFAQVDVRYAFCSKTRHSPQSAYPESRSIHLRLFRRNRRRTGSRALVPTSGRGIRYCGQNHLRLRQGSQRCDAQAAPQEPHSGRQMVPKEHRHAPMDQQQKTLNAKLRGHYQYYGRPTNSQSLLKFYRGVVRIWRKWLNRRTRGNRMTWERYKQLLRRYPLLSPQIRHPWTYPESPA